MAPQGADYFATSMKGARVPTLKGKVLWLKPAVNPRVIVMTLGDGITPDVRLEFDKPMLGKIEPGMELSFEGIPESFSTQPFMVVFKVERDKLHVWTEKNAPPPPGSTRIGEHHMGETVQEWLAITLALDGMETVCGSRKRADKDRCKEQRNLQETIDRRRGLPLFLKTGSIDDRTMEWEFDDGKLAKVDVSPGFDLSNLAEGIKIKGTIQEEIRFLTETYGEPTTISTVPYQNSYGAKWDCLEANWDMPDGTHILAAESIASGQRRLYSVLFVSKEWMGKQQQKGKPNPYK
jgi:hypothetical protein